MSNILIKMWANANPENRLLAEVVVTFPILGIITAIDTAFEGTWPPWSQAGAVVFVTFCTKDSIPKDVLVYWSQGKRLENDTSRVQRESLTHNERLSKIFVPIAMPLTAGPGAITTVITIALAEPYWKNLSVALTAIVVMVSVLWVTLLLSQRVQGLLGPLGQKILVRFFGLILVAIGVQFILTGVHEFYISAMAEQLVR